MNEFHLVDPELNRRLEVVINTFFDQLPILEKEMTRRIFMRYKRYSDNEYYLYIITVYALIFFKRMHIDHPFVSEEDREILYLMSITFQYEMSGNMEMYIQTMLELNEDLFLLKLIIKYTILLAEEEYGGYIPNRSEYYHSLGWLIPILSYKNYDIMANPLQDVYFKKLYSEEYEWTRKAHETPVQTIEFIENFMVDMTNDMTAMMEKLNIFGMIKMRKKSLFSIFNKMINKQSTKIYDFVWMRTIFQNENDLARFAAEFEKHFIVKIKKDYITHPKENGYRGIHYSFVYTYRNFETEVELQIRTREINEIITQAGSLTHFMYSCEYNKWNPIFKEVHRWAAMVLKYAQESGLEIR